MVSPSENREAAYRLKSKTDLPVGTELTVHGFLAKDRTTTANPNTVWKEAMSWW